MTGRPTPAIVVMGVQGCGKSTVGALLAERLGVAFVDGDDLHPEANKSLMAAGTPLTDADRIPWLEAVGQELGAGAPAGIVVACSALKRAYRDLLRTFAPDLVVIHPHGPIELVAERISRREHEYMPPSLLLSQYAALEGLQEDERGLTVDLTLPLPAIVDAAALFLEGDAASAH